MRATRGLPFLPTPHEHAVLLLWHGHGMAWAWTKEDVGWPGLGALTLADSFSHPGSPKGKSGMGCISRDGQDSGTVHRDGAKAGPALCAGG
jgi:hypothetical protein